MSKKITRRDFIKGTVAAGACACCTAAWGPLGPNAVYAQSSGGNGRMAVFLNQFGGNDQLNSFAIPYIRSAYFDRRPTIAIPVGQVLPMASGIGLNPRLSALHALYQAGDVAIVQNVGDPRGTRSHFTAQEIFSRGIAGPSGTEQRGWIGRLGDLYMSNMSFNTLGIGVGAQTDFTATRATNRPIVTNSLSSVGFNTDFGAGTNDRNFRLATLETLLAENKPVDERPGSVRRAQAGMIDSVDTLRNVVSGYTGGAVSYTTGGENNVSRYLRDCARIAQFGLGTRVCYGGEGGWDNHSDQRSVQESQLTRINDAVNGFHQDMVRINQWNNVVICIFTEFGRNTYENGSSGTDHGWGSAMVLIGGRVRGGVYGVTPSENVIRNQRWLDMDIDFRNVFADIISWLGFNPGPVFPESYARVALDVVA